VPATATHPAGTLRGGGYDPDSNTVYLGGVGHPRGVAAVGGDPTKPQVAGISVFHRGDGTIFWANDSRSLPRGLTPEEAAAVQQGLEQTYPGSPVRQLSRIADVPLN
jgi:hypothetical protein